MLSVLMWFLTQIRQPEVRYTTESGKGTRMRVERKNKLPGIWHKFLRVGGKQFQGLIVMTHGDSLCSSVP